MADDPKTPVAIRITRPYVTEDEFLEREFDTLTRTSVILLGAQSRPQGVVLRFEIVLKGGESILRGEGRVVGYKEKAYGGEPGLTLRFTRLDARSKSLVDRAGLLRDARVRASASLMSMPAVVVPAAPFVPEPTLASPEPPPAIPSSRPSAPPSSRRGPPPLPEWATSQPPPPVSSTSSVPPPPPSSAAAIDSMDMEVESTQVDSTFHAAIEAAVAPAKPRIPSPPPPPLPPRARSKAPPPLPGTSVTISGFPAPAPPSAPPPAPRPSRAPVPPTPSRVPAAARAHVEGAVTGRAVERPKDRDALLHRLRIRGQSLSPERVRDILARRAAH